MPKNQSITPKEGFWLGVITGLLPFVMVLTVGTAIYKMSDTNIYYKTSDLEGSSAEYKLLDKQLRTTVLRHSHAAMGHHSINQLLKEPLKD